MLPLQRYAEDLKYYSHDAGNLCEAAQFTVNDVQVVGPAASPSKRVLLSTSEATRQRMKAWRDSTLGVSGLSNLMCVILEDTSTSSSRAAGKFFNCTCQRCIFQGQFGWSPSLGGSNTCLVWLQENICFLVSMAVKVLRCVSLL